MFPRRSLFGATISLVRLRVTYTPLRGTLQAQRLFLRAVAPPPFG